MATAAVKKKDLASAASGKTPAVNVHDPKWHRAEGIKQMMAKGNDRKEAERIVDTVILEKCQPWNEGLHHIRAREDARIHFTSKGECYFQQGDIMFPVDSQNLNAVVGGGYEQAPSVIDKLMDSQIVSLATANHLPVHPYVRELVREPLIGIIQMVWYRDIEQHESEHLRENQRKRLIDYHRHLLEYKEPEDGAESKKSGAAPRAQRNWSGEFRYTGKNKGVASGRETQLLEVMKKLKQATLAQIVEAAKGKLQTKQDFQVIVTRFLRELISHEAVEEMKGEKA